jgi:hypothetical protein
VLVDAILKKLLVLEWYDIGYNHFSTDSDAGLAGVRYLYSGHRRFATERHFHAIDTDSPAAVPLTLPRHC